MVDITTFPPLPEPVLNSLKEMIPPPRPTPASTEREDCYTSGRYSVVELLQAIFDHQNQVVEEE